MNNLLDMLFLNNININKDLFSNLYFSYDDISFVGYNDKLIRILKKYDNYKIIKERITEVGEKHHEYKYIIDANLKYFIRILSDDRNLIYDIMIYKIDDIDKINKIFFPYIELIPANLIKLNKAIIKIESNNINLIYNHKLFTKYLGYEDWDYKNKCLNRLDYSSIDIDFINNFKEIDFDGYFKFKTNNDSIVNLNIHFKYIDGYYIIDKISF